jgi:two-component system sensor histidine kinase/response regulator
VARGRILIVDGDGPFRAVLHAYLVERGHLVDALADGRAALARWDEIHPALVVTDLGGGDLDGFDFIAALARRGDRPSVLVCTPLQAAAQWDRAVLDALGVAELVTRPAAFPALAAKIEELLDARAQSGPRLSAPVATQALAAAGGEEEPTLPSTPRGKGTGKGRRPVATGPKR